MKTYIFLLTWAALILTITCNEGEIKRKVCYLSSFSSNRITAETRFYPEDIDPSLCTHILYGGANFDGEDVVPTIPSDLPSSTEKGSYEEILDLAKDNNVQVILTVLGWKCDSGKFGKMLVSDTARSNFVSKAIRFAREHKFNGLCVHCLFYGNNTVDPEIRSGLSSLVAEMRNSIDQDAKYSGQDKLILTLDVYGPRALDDSSYDYRNLHKNVDWINLLAAFLHSPIDGTTGHHSPIQSQFNSVKTSNKVKDICIDEILDKWLDNGTPKSKIVLSLPAIGVSFVLKGDDAGIGAPALKFMPRRYNFDGDMLSYYEICEWLNGYWFESNHLKYIPHSRLPYLVSGNLWVGFDNILSIITRIQHIKKRGLGGFVFLSLENDDFTGKFCGEGRYPLLTAANYEYDN